MSRLICGLLLLSAVTCAVASCTGRSESNNEPVAPVAKPPSWDDQSDNLWPYRSQFKAHMRHLWLDANRLVSAGRGDARPTFNEIYASAADISRRAGLMHGFWKGIADHAQMLQMAVEDDDRPGATEEMRELGLSCDGCHMATWSPAYLHVTLHTIDAWKANQIKLGMEMETDKEPPPEIPNRVVMQSMWKQFQAAESALKAWNKAEALRQVEQISGMAKTRAALWRTVQENADALVELARAERKQGLSQAYTDMTAACRTCHAAFAGPERPVHNPMPWDGPTK